MTNGDTLEGLGESGLIRILAELAPGYAEGVLLGIGDDAALLRVAPGMVVAASADTLVEGIHFRRRTHSPEQIGYKALAVNLSDMAAMGARGRFILCQAGFPSGTSIEFFRRLFTAMVTRGRDYGLTLVGGDLTATFGPGFLAVTILGEVEPDRALRRSGARPGDILAVSGRPGESGAGLLLLESDMTPAGDFCRRVIQRHLEPEPKLRLSEMAASSGVVHAAIDVSDGFSTDLANLCRAGNIHCLVDADSLPLSAALCGAARRLGRDPLDLFLNGGEDYELLLAVDPGGWPGLKAQADAAGEELAAVGEFSEGPPGADLKRGLSITPLAPGGFDHFHP